MAYAKMGPLVDCLVQKVPNYLQLIISCFPVVVVMSRPVWLSEIAVFCACVNLQQVIRHLWWKKEKATEELTEADSALKSMPGGDPRQAIEVCVVQIFIISIEYNF